MSRNVDDRYCPPFATAGTSALGRLSGAKRTYEACLCALLERRAKAASGPSDTTERKVGMIYVRGTSTFFRLLPAAPKFSQARRICDCAGNFWQWSPVRGRTCRLSDEGAARQDEPGRDHSGNEKGERALSRRREEKSQLPQ